MTILPSTKVKKIRKEEKRNDDWSGNQSGCSSSSSHLHRSSHLPSSSSSSSHHPPPHPPHLSSISPGPPRKVARLVKGDHSSSPSLAPLSSPLQPSPLSQQPPLTSPRGSREEKKTEEEPDGPNSDDEYDRGFRDEELERSFENSLREERGLEIKKTVGDGACLFRAVSHQIYGDQEMHGEVRRLCMDYMEANREHFEQFITEDFSAYITRKRRLTVHGNHVELQAISEIYNRPIEIYEYNLNPINVFHPKSTSGMEGGGGQSGSSTETRETRETREARDGGKKEEMNAPIRMSYHGSTHYNAVIDPRVATVGVGLGLPAFEPGMADRKLLAEAINKSEMHQIEQAMLKDKLSMTDWERTEEDLKDQALRESYLEYTRLMESNDPSTSSSSSSRRPLPSPPPSPPPAPPSSSPLPAPSRPFVSSSPQPCSSRHVHASDAPPPPAPKESGGGAASLYEELLMAEAMDWNEDAAYDSSLAEALLMSQQSFFTECIRRPEGEAEGE